MTSSLGNLSCSPTCTLKALAPARPPPPPHLSLPLHTHLGQPRQVVRGDDLIPGQREAQLRQLRPEGQEAIRGHHGVTHLQTCGQSEGFQTWEQSGLLVLQKYRGPSNGR